MAVVGLSLTMLVYRYYTHEWDMRFFFNADTLYLPTLFRDVIADPGAWKRWYLTPAPYFFPDMPLYLIAYGINSDPYHTQSIYFCIQLALCTVLLFLTFSSFYSRVNAILISATTVSIYAFFLSAGVSSLLYALTNAFHYGAFMGLIAGYVLTLKIMYTNNSKIYTNFFMLLALISLITVSDRIFLIQFTIPLILAISYLWYKNRLQSGKAVSICTACLAGTAAGFALERLLIHHKTAHPVHLGIGVLDGNALTFANILKNFTMTAPGAMVIIIIFYIICLLIMAFPDRLRNAGPIRVTAPHLLLAVLTSTSAAASIAVALLATNLSVTDRYMIPMLTAPVLLFPAILTVVEPKIRAKTATLLAAAALLATVPAIMLRIPFGAEIQPAWYPEIAQCVDRLATETGLRNGLAQYWHSKPILVFSRENVKVAQYVDALEPMLWINDSGRYAQAYDFAIVEPGPTAIDEAYLRSIAGEPSMVLPCADARILVYGEGGLKIPPS
jgi:hypothetical protein